MKSVRAAVLAGLLATLAAGCSPAASTSVRAQGSAGATASELAFVKALAQGRIIVKPQLVAGPVMTAYFSFQQELDAAMAATGNPGTARSVSSVPGGYRLCVATVCTDFTAFTTNATGQITGVSVNGHPVKGHIATGGSSSMQGLRVSDVIAYRLTTPVGIVFKIQDVSYPVSKASPPAAGPSAAFSTPSGQVPADISESALPSSLSPGVTVYAEATFDTTDVTGTFELLSNDGFNLLLASSTIALA
jgi:hypothetical protein